MAGFPALGDQRRGPLVGEVLSASASVPEAVARPAIVKLWQDHSAHQLLLKLADGGVWMTDTSLLAPEVLKQRGRSFDVATIFADNPSLFTFVLRKDPVRVRRG